MQARLLAPGSPAFRIALHLLAAAFFAYVFLLCLNPLGDPDLWFHLRAGQWVVEHKALHGAEDPFSYTTPYPLSEGQLKGLRTQWLGQVFYYMLYRAGGYSGLAMVRSLMVVLPFALMYVYFTRRRDVHPLGALVSLAVPAMFISQLFYTSFERPQSVSFLLAVLVYALLRRMRRQERRGRLFYIQLPLIMAFWANLHGGYVIGVGIIAAFIASELVGIAIRKWRPGATNTLDTSAAPWPFIAACALGALGSALNPGGFMLINWVRSLAGSILMYGAAGLRQGVVMNDVMEYKSIWFFSEQLNDEWPYFAAAIYIATGMGLLVKYITTRKLDPAEALVFGMMAFFGTSYARGVVFAVLFCAFINCWSLHYLRASARSLAITLGMAAIAAVFLARLIAISPWQLDPEPPAAWVENDYPEEAVRFLYERDVKGPMFNLMQWGGYLIWRANPRYKVFFDGREISMNMTRVYSEVVRGTAGWRGVLDVHGVNFLLVPVLARENGVLLPMLFRMAMEGPGPWRLVYLYDNVAIFVRKGTMNEHVIECCEKPFADLYRQIVDVSDIMLIKKPGDPDILLSKAFGLFWMGRAEDALVILNSIPPNQISEKLRLQILSSRG